MGTVDAGAPGILLVHGSWHGPWCWAAVAAGLSAGGRRVLAVELAGHGLRARLPVSATARPFDPGAFAAERSPVASVDLDVAGELLVSQIESFAVTGPVVVVAHSAGGPVLMRAAQTVPRLVRHMVYLAAFMPASGRAVADYRDVPEQDGDRLAPLWRGDPAANGALRLDVGSGGRYRQQLRDALYNDVHARVADAAIALLTPDSPVALGAGTTTLTAAGWGGVPRTYVHCARDFAIRPALQRRFVAEADAAFPDNPTTVAGLDSSHSPFLSMPDRVTDLVAAVR